MKLQQETKDFIENKTAEDIYEEIDGIMLLDIYQNSKAENSLKKAISITSQSIEAITNFCKDIARKDVNIAEEDALEAMKFLNKEFTEEEYISSINDIMNAGFKVAAFVGPKHEHYHNIMRKSAQALFISLRVFILDNAPEEQKAFYNFLKAIVTNVAKSEISVEDIKEILQNG